MFRACTVHFLHDGTHDSVFVLLPLWAETFGLNFVQIGALKSIYSGALAIFQMPAGMLSEFMGLKPILLIGTCMTGVFFALTATANGFWVLLILIALTGISASVQHPTGSAIVSNTTEPASQRTALGIYNFSGDLGKMFVAFLIGLIATKFDWRMATMAIGLIVIIVGLAVLLTLTAPPYSVSIKSPTAEGKDSAAKIGWGFTDQIGFSILSIVHIFDSVCRTGLLTFLPFLLVGKGASTFEIGTAYFLIFAGGAFGKLLCGLVGDKIGIFRTIVLTEIATTVLIISTIFVPLTILLLILPLLGLALNGTSSVLYGTVGEFVRSERQARAFGLFYSFGSAASAISPLVFGLISDLASVEISLSLIAILSFTIVPVSMLLRGHLLEFHQTSYQK